MMLTKRQPPITVEEHITLGKHLAEAMHALHVVMSRLPNVSSTAYRRAYQCEKRLQMLCSALDDMVCAITTHSDPRNLAIRVYYGADLVRDEVVADPGDSFAGWSAPPHG